MILSLFYASRAYISEAIVLAARLFPPMESLDHLTTHTVQLCYLA